MRPRHHPCGFLLIEAALTAAVLAVSLVFIARGIGRSLGVLSNLRQHQRVLDLAQAKLIELELQAQHGQPVAAQTAPFEPPAEAYQWTLAHEELSSNDVPDELQSGVRLVTVTVTPKASPGPQVRLQTVWSAEWLQ